MLQFFPIFSDGDVPSAGALAQTVATWGASLPLRLEAWLGVTESDSAFGPLFFLQTSLLLSSLRARVTFLDGFGRRASREAALVAPAERVTPPRQMLRASFPQPEVAMQVRDLDGRPLTDQARIGCCANGLREADAVFTGDVDIALRLTRHAPTRDGATRLTVGGELAFAHGAALRIEFQSPPRGREPAHASGADVVVVPAGRTLRFPVNTMGSEEAGNPWISVELVDDSGVPIGEERPMGRLLSD